LKDRMLGGAIIAAIVILSAMAIPTVLSTVYAGGQNMPKTTSTTILSSTGTMSVVTTPEFSGGIDWILFLAVASLVVLIRRTNQVS